MNEFFKEKPSIKDIVKALGQSVWDGLTGDLRFVLSHLDWYKLDKKLTKTQVKELAQRSARAYEEGVQIIMTAVMAVKAVTAIKIKDKIKVPLKQQEVKSAKKYVAKPGPNVKKATKGVGGAKTSVRDELLGNVENLKLKNSINEIYRPGAKTGDGGLADAVRHELKTGELVGGKSHIQKATERVTNLENIIKKQNLNPNDLKIANDLLKDLKNALGGQ